MDRKVGLMGRLRWEEMTDICYCNKMKWHRHILPRLPLSCLSIFLIVLLDVTQTFMCGNRLRRYIANIASLDRWLATIGNHCLRWLINLKNIAKTLALIVTKIIASLTMLNLRNEHLWKWKHLEKHENQPETMKTNRKPWKYLGSHKNQPIILKNQNIKPIIKDG